MREICKSGSEGGASQANETSLPLSAILIVDKMRLDRSFWAMSRSKRASVEGWNCHVWNHANAKSPIIKTPEDFETFERVLVEAVERTEIRLLAYCVLRNHGHLVVWSEEVGNSRDSSDG